MILRSFTLVVVAVLFTAALFWAIVDPGVWPMALVSGAFLAGIVFERRRYGAAQHRPVGGAWQETAERFIDDASGRPVTVWFNPATGERRYVDSGGDEGH
ncbi:MAG: hypothetical protein M3R41_08765 [Pseudomonadota bacterium]|nr:hypothetical protein [Pseudomonadota bacterium]